MSLQGTNDEETIKESTDKVFKYKYFKGMNDFSIFITEMETEKEKVDMCVCLTGCYDFTFIHSKNIFFSIKGH